MISYALQLRHASDATYRAEVTDQLNNGDKSHWPLALFVLCYSRRQIPVGGCVPFVLFTNTSMKINGWFLGIIVALFCTLAGYGQAPPPNDNYSNRTVLTGNDITFSGTLAGATIEDSQETTAYEQLLGVTPTQSVWWSWTAPVSTVLTLQIRSSSLDYSHSPIISQLPYRVALVVYTFATNSMPLGLQVIDFRFAPETLSIPVRAGTEYQIQLIGTSSGGYTFGLTATNTPVIVQQPRSRTVYSNATALFYVVAAGTNQPAFAFQWCSNGTPIPGETAPMLAISNIDSSMAAAYSVIVSNSAGATNSDPAMLSVSQSNVPILLAVTGLTSNSLAFSLTGENGRSYRIESSPDLVNWARDVEFDLEPVTPDTTSVVFNPNSPLDLTVSNNSNNRFFRAEPYVVSSFAGDPPSAADECVNHLEQIRIAKLLWQRDYDNAPIIPYATPWAAGLIPYFPRHQAPYCPDNINQIFASSYQINDLLTEPACYIVPSYHILEEPR